MPVNKLSTDRDWSDEDDAPDLSSPGISGSSAANVPSSVGVLNSL